jgi:protein AroM
MTQTIGLVGTGQLPRPDIVPAIREILGPQLKIIERGALDGMVRSQIDELGRKDGDHRLLTRVSDGSFVVVGTREITPLVQEAIDDVVSQGAEIVGLLFTADLHQLHSTVPLLHPRHLMQGLVSSLLPAGRLGVVVSLDSDQQPAVDRWQADMRQVIPATALPYGDPREIERISHYFVYEKADLIVMDSMGYTREHRRQVAGITKKIVIIPKTILARTILDIAD